MSASIEISFNTKLEYDSGGGSFVEIGEVLGNNGPEHSAKVINVSALRDLVARKKVGRPDSGDVTLQIGYTKTIYNLMLGFFKARTAKTFRLTMPEGSTDAFSAFVSKVGRKVQDEEKIMFDVTLSVDGDNTFTPA